MNIEQIARECWGLSDEDEINMHSINKFANAILEEAAKECEEIDNSSYPHTRKWPSDCAEAIRKLKS